jgi:hypothetical protein
VRAHTHTHMHTHTHVHTHAQTAQGSAAAAKARLLTDRLAALTNGIHDSLVGRNIHIGSLKG